MHPIPAGPSAPRSEAILLRGGLLVGIDGEASVADGGGPFVLDDGTP